MGNTPANGFVAGIELNGKDGFFAMRNDVKDKAAFGEGGPVQGAPYYMTCTQAGSNVNCTANFQNCRTQEFDIGGQKIATQVCDAPQGKVQPLPAGGAASGAGGAGISGSNNWWGWILAILIIVIIIVIVVALARNGQKQQMVVPVAQPVVV